MQGVKNTLFDPLAEKGGIKGQKWAFLGRRGC